MTSILKMTGQRRIGTYQVSRFSRYVLLLIGSFNFAFLLGEMIHEVGHFLAHLAVGNPGVRVQIDPFGGSKILGVTSLSNGIGLTSAAGTLLNLLLGAYTLLKLRKKTSLIWLPFMILGPLAMLQEGVSLTLGLLTPGGDAQWIVNWGGPLLLLLIFGILLLSSGIFLVSRLLLFAVLDGQESIRERFIIVLCGVSFLMLLRISHSIFFSPGLTMVNLFPFLFSLLLSAIIVMVSNLIPSTNTNGSEIKLNKTTWVESVSAISLGTGMFLFQMMVGKLIISRDGRDRDEKCLEAFT